MRKIGWLGLVLIASSCDLNDDYIVKKAGAAELLFEQDVFLAVKTKKKQDLQASFDIYPGVPSYYYDKWESKVWETEYNCDLSDVSFKISVEVQDENSNIIDLSYLAVGDFPSKDKYIVTFETIEGAYDAYIINFGEDYITTTYDFSKAEISNGYVKFGFGLYDNIDNSLVEFRNESFSVVAYCSSRLIFSLKENTLYFSETNSY